MNNGQRPTSNRPVVELRPGGGGGRGPRINKEKPKNMGKTLKRLLGYIGKSKLLVILLIVIMAVVTVADLAGPAMQGAAIDTIKIVDGKLTVDMPAMLTCLAIMGVLFVINATLSNKIIRQAMVTDSVP